MTQQSRREFFKKVLYNITFVFPALMLGYIGWSFSSSPTRIELINKINLGPIQNFKPGINERRDLKIALIRNENQLTAVSLECTHLGCIVNQSGDGFICPCHGSSFKKNGEVIRGAAIEPLQTYPVEVTQDGQVLLDLSNTKRKV